MSFLHPSGFTHRQRNHKMPALGGGGFPTGTAAWNPLVKGTHIVLTPDNKTASIVSNTGYIIGTTGVDASENRYFEVECSSSSGAQWHMGVGIAKAGVLLNLGGPGCDATSWGWYQEFSGGFSGKITNYSMAGYVANAAPPQRIGVQLNAGELTFYRDGVSKGVAFTGLSGTFYAAWGPFGSAANTNYGTIYEYVNELLYLPAGCTPWNTT